MAFFEKECEEIHKSSGRKSSLISFLATKNKKEKKQIRETFKKMYDQDLTNFLLFHKNKEEDEFSEALWLWMLEPHVFDVFIARKALEGTSMIDFKALIEIFVSRKSSHIHLFTQLYQKMYKKKIEQDILNIEPPNPYQKILVALCTSHQAHEVEISEEIAKCDAKRVFESGERRGGFVDEEVMIEILSKRSILQLKLTFSCYKQIYGHTYSKWLKKGKKKEFEEAIRVVVKCICDPPKYYAKELESSLRVKGQLRKLTRVVIRRAEIDMEDVKKELFRKFGIEVKTSVLEHISSGYYRDFLLALLSNSNLVD